jgi:hypothetical protein
LNQSITFKRLSNTNIANKKNELTIDSKSLMPLAINDEAMLPFKMVAEVLNILP